MLTWCDISCNTRILQHDDVSSLLQFIEHLYNSHFYSSLQNGFLDPLLLYKKIVNNTIPGSTPLHMLSLALGFDITYCMWMNTYS